MDRIEKDGEGGRRMGKEGEGGGGGGGTVGAARRLAMNSFDGRFKFGSPLAAARRSTSQ